MLIGLLSKVFPSIDLPEHMPLWHGGLLSRNIMVADNEDTTTTLDWESAPVTPLWKALPVFQFSSWPYREKRPRYGRHADVNRAWYH